GDPTKCHPCEPVKACLNGCGHCELCIGKDMLPPDCAPDAGAASSGSGGGMQCDMGIQPCGLPGQSPCPVNFYCISGCCQPVPNQPVSPSLTRGTSSRTAARSPR